jgi:hypothetical protein
MSAGVPGSSVRATSVSPPVTTDDAGPILGKGNTRASTPTVADVLAAITPATKSASNTIEAFGASPNTSTTDSVNSVCRAVEIPPGRYSGRNTRPSVCSAVRTDGSVHGISWRARRSYIAPPAVCR